MRLAVGMKFEQGVELRVLLLATGDAELVEGNSWHDNDWGDCWCDRCVEVLGANMLGVILMEVRGRLGAGV